MPDEPFVPDARELELRHWAAAHLKNVAQTPSENCPICVEPYTNFQGLRPTEHVAVKITNITACPGHIFGVKCIIDWLVMKYKRGEDVTCPMCRGVLLHGSVTEEEDGEDEDFDTEGEDDSDDELHEANDGTEDEDGDDDSEQDNEETGGTNGENDHEHEEESEVLYDGGDDIDDVLDAAFEDSDEEDIDDDEDYEEPDFEEERFEQHHHIDYVEIQQELRQSVFEYRTQEHYRAIRSIREHMTTMIIHGSARRTRSETRLLEEVAFIRAAHEYRQPGTTLHFGNAGQGRSMLAHLPFFRSPRSTPADPDELAQELVDLVLEGR